MGNYYKIMISAVARLDLIWGGGGGGGGDKSAEDGRELLGGPGACSPEDFEISEIAFSAFQ